MWFTPVKFFETNCVALEIETISGHCPCTGWHEEVFARMRESHFIDLVLLTLKMM